MNGIINFETNIGTVLMIRSVTVIPKQSALIKFLHVDGVDGVEKHKIIMEGDDYLAWGNDDNYIGNYCLDKITGGKATIVGSDYIARAPSAPGTNDDNRSVHNDADIARIQTLQEHLDVQAGKLKTITDLLFKNGAI
jgi:hypothetical protein